MKILTKNPPSKLLKIADEWNSKGKSFYLGPENLFMYNSQEISYVGEEGISKVEGDWYICTEDQRVPLRGLYKEEVEDISNVLLEDYNPPNAVLYIDYKCNSQCHVCAYHGDNTEFYDNNFESAKVTLSLDKAKERIDKLVSFGIKNLSIVSNGEIFVYKYWEELFRYAVSKGFKIGFNTNGFMLDEERIKKLVDIGNISWVEVSLHSIDFDIWSSFTGATNKKIFERVQVAPLLLKKYGIVSCVAAVRTERTIDGLKDYLDYWIPKVDQVTIVNQIHKDFFSCYKPDYSMPLGICVSAHSTLYILPNGLVGQCGIVSCCTDDNRYGVSNWNIDNMDVADIVSEIKKAWKNKEFYEICAHCPRKGTKSSEIIKSAYGYKCYCEGMISNRFNRALNIEDSLKGFINRKVKKFLINCIPNQKKRRELRSKL